MKNIICYFGLLLFLMSPVPSFAGTTLFVSPDGDGAFIIEGDNIGSADYIEITVSYDQTILAHPRVSLQGGSVFNVYDGIPGVLTFNSYRGDNNNSSFEAHLNFDKKGDSQGGIISVHANTREPDGSDAPSRSILNLPSPPVSTAQEAESTPELVSAIASDEGGDSRSEDESGKEHAGGTQPANSAPCDAEAASRPEKRAVAVGPHTVSNNPDTIKNTEKSVLQRFKEFKGERGLKTFVALFERPPRNASVQEPLVALSDGKTPVRLKLELQTKGGGAPNFALIDAELVHVQKESEKEWVITIMPQAGSWNSSLHVMIDEESSEFPLVVAPPATIRKEITERTFVTELDRFIVEQVGRGNGQNDPSRRVPYEYIFTANYLARSEHQASRHMTNQSSLVSNSKK
jgi:hypothetical protein